MKCLFGVCGTDLSLVVNSTDFVPKPDEGRAWIEILLDVRNDEQAIEYVLNHLMTSSDINGTFKIFSKKSHLVAAHVPPHIVESELVEFEEESIITALR